MTRQVHDQVPCTALPPCHQPNDEQCHVCSYHRWYPHGVIAYAKWYHHRCLSIASQFFYHHVQHYVRSYPKRKQHLLSN